jgi:hypothetical protein
MKASAAYPLEMASLALIGWPYHAGLADISMGLGANTLLADERLRSAVRRQGGEVRCESVPPVDEALPEVARIFELDRRLALRVAEARQRHQFPLVSVATASAALRPPRASAMGESLASSGSMPTPTSTHPRTTSPDLPT